MEAKNAPAEFDDKLEEAQTVTAMTAKEIKAKYKPEFAANPDKFYPTKVFEKIGYTRAQCKCGANYWRHSEKADTCGDSQCVGSYKFIGKGTGIGRKGNPITYAEAWQGFQKSLSSARVPCKAIDRYPVVARWRNDVDYVAAGIYCFQPYCVTGELDPPANPLICPQFCVRFNDLDNIGLTGRHYSGFVMLGIQVFNYPDNYVFFKEECVEFNHRWLTEELGIDPDEITYVEDVWAGGGNCGPSMEYFIGGLEVGNMVFMQFKTFHDGSREELPIKIIDVGIGLERIPWLINGTATSYMDVFKNAYTWLSDKLSVSVDNAIWEKFGPLSCRLNVDEIDDPAKVWGEISSQIGEEVDTVRKAVNEAKELYIVLDHTRTLLMIIQDGSLPSNAGGGGNVRNILRRVFALLKKNNWWDKLKLEGFIELCQMHKKDLEGIYGKFPEYKSFANIIQIEYERWTNTDNSQRVKLEAMIKKKKKFELQDWKVAVTSLGIPVDVIAQVSGQPVPDNLYYEIAQDQEKTAKVAEVILYNTTHLAETDNLFYTHPNEFAFKGKILDVFANLKQNNARNIVILDRSSFYPTSGGQQNDVGSLQIDGESYQVLNCEKVGKCVLHILDRPLPNEDISHYKGLDVTGSIDEERRRQLRNHHTATHIVFASCRKVLGPHVWQAGAKKTIDQAHLDITHFTSITKQEEVEIENEANRIILRAKTINKYFMDKAQAELEFGFRLYQGGIVPGNQLRVVHIEDTDVEACCGTHADNTSEVGWIKLLRTTRIADGTVRLYFVAGEKTIERLNSETDILNQLSDLWSVHYSTIVDTASRIFKEYKSLQNTTKKQEQTILNLQTKYVINSGDAKNVVFKSDEADSTIYFSFLGASAFDLKERGKSIAFVGGNFVYAILGDPKILDLEKLKAELQKKNPQANLRVNTQIKHQDKKTKKKVDVKDIAQFSYIGDIDTEGIINFLASNGFTVADV